MIELLSRIIDYFLLKKLLKHYKWKKEDDKFYTKGIWNLHYDEYWMLDSNKSIICKDKPLGKFKTLNQKSFEQIEHFIKIDERAKELLNEL